MAQTSNPTGNSNGGYPLPSTSLSSRSGTNAVPTAASSDPIPAAAVGPVAVAALLHQQQQQQQQQHHQANFLQQLQQQQHQQPQPTMQPPPQQCQQRTSPPQPPQSQQFIPGPFYTLQQQQAFAQARLAAAALQAQQQQQEQQQATLQVQQQQQQQHAAYSFIGQQQQQQPQPMTTSTSSPTMAALPVLNHNNNAAAGTPSSSVNAATAAPSRNKKRKQSSSPELQIAAKNPPSPAKSNGPPSATSMATAKATAGAPSKGHEKSPESSKDTPPSADAQTHGMSSTAAQLIQNAMAESNSCDIPATSTSPTDASVGDVQHHNHHGGNRPLTAAEKKQSSRDRNREHARCTRLRKKAYVNKLKELVDGLHAERSEDARKRRVAVQHLTEIQGLRRKVVNTFLEYHSRYERDETKWGTILDKDFWLKQPVTPYRSFRRCEIQKGSRILKGVNAMIRDSASMSVMIETIGSRNLRWMQRKRDDFLASGVTSKRPSAGGGRMRMGSRANGGGNMPHSIGRRNSRLQHAVSSLSSSGSSTGTGSGAEEERRSQRRKSQGGGEHRGGHHLGEEKESQRDSASDDMAKKVSSSSSGSDDARLRLRDGDPPSNDFHDYHAPSLPDPLPESSDSGSRGDPPRDMDSDNCIVGERVCTDSSVSSSSNDVDPRKKTNATEGKSHTASKQKDAASSTALQASSSTTTSYRPPPVRNNLPPNIAKSGGIQHNVKVVQIPQSTAASSVATTMLPNGHANLSRAPAVALPPFAGIGRMKHPSTKQQAAGSSTGNGHNDKYHPIAATSSSTLLPRGPTLPPVPHHHDSSEHDGDNNSNHQKNEEEENQDSNNSNLLSSSRSNIITIDNRYASASSQSSSQSCNRGISAHYHINEDDMIITDDVLMCPFIFRSQEAVWCGALAECVQPGMLRAAFSKTNKLRNVEMIFDAMGFCQQLERASGNEGMAQIIPNSLEMALGTPNTDEYARVITLAKGPDFKIVSVNEAFTRVTGYTQFDVEGKDVRSVLSGGECQAEEGAGTTMHDFETVAKKGVCAASTNMHHDRNRREFLNYMCSYPLSNLRDEVTHILHVCQELPARECD